MMGLWVSHGCFNGAYSAFNRLRQFVALTCGGSFPPHAADFRADDGAEVLPDHWHWEPKIVPDRVKVGMDLFFSHSDCDGEWSPGEAAEVASFLRWVVTACPVGEEGAGHLAGDMQGHVLTFAKGCAAAASANEIVRFG